MRDEEVGERKHAKNEDESMILVVR